VSEPARLVHPAAQAFGAVADQYERARPDYPQAAIDLLAERLGIGPTATVVDVAAGTGKLTRRLVPLAERVVAVEPVAGMRERLAATVPGAEVLAGTAECIPLPDGAADAATVAQAFHWFRGDEALAELHRVLRPGGSLGLLWARRDLDQPLQAEITRIVRGYRGTAPAHRGDAWRAAFRARADLFGPLAEGRMRFRQRLDGDGLVARVGSMSFVAALPAERRADVLGRVRALVASPTEAVELAYVGEVLWCERRERG